MPAATLSPDPGVARPLWGLLPSPRGLASRSQHCLPTREVTTRVQAPCGLRAGGAPLPDGGDGSGQPWGGAHRPHPLALAPGAVLRARGGPARSCPSRWAAWRAWAFCGVGLCAWQGPRCPSGPPAGPPPASALRRGFQAAHWRKPPHALPVLRTLWSAQEVAAGAAPPPRPQEVCGGGWAGGGGPSAHTFPGSSCRLALLPPCASAPPGLVWDPAPAERPLFSSSSVNPGVSCPVPSPTRASPLPRPSRGSCAGICEDRVCWLWCRLRCAGAAPLPPALPPAPLPPGAGQLRPSPEGPHVPWGARPQS